MRKRQKKRRKRKQNGVAGLLMLELLGLVVVLSLATLSRDLRSDTPPRDSARITVNSEGFAGYENRSVSPQTHLQPEKTLPGLARWHYNARLNSDSFFPESSYGSRPYSR